MLLVISGDWHATDKRPRYRTDKDYLATCIGKVKQIVNIANDNNGIIIQPGDLVDSAKVPYKVTSALIDTLRNTTLVISTLGQHDVHYHVISDTVNTPAGILQRALPKKFNVLTSGGSFVRAESESSKNHRVRFFGRAWGESIDDLVSCPKRSNEVWVLVMHRMVTSNGPLFPGQTNYDDARSLLRKLKNMDLIVVGDNHNSFDVEYKGRYLFNCGSLMRSNIDQVDHHPHVWLFDTDHGAAKRVYLEVQDADDVLDVKKAEQAKDQQEKLQVFIDGLDNSTDVVSSFKDNLRRVIESYDGSDKQELETVLAEVMDER